MFVYFVMSNKTIALPYHCPNRLHRYVSQLYWIIYYIISYPLLHTICLYTYTYTTSTYIYICTHASHLSLFFPLRVRPWFSRCDVVHLHIATDKLQRSTPLPSLSPLQQREDSHTDLLI